MRAQSSSDRSHGVSWRGRKTRRPVVSLDAVVYRRSMKVAAVIRALETDGWQIVRTRGSHRQFKHPVKPGRVTVAGKRSAELPPKTLASIRKQARLEDLR